MSDDDGFLDAIRSAPDDEAPRLIYADWLEERGDRDRARLIRTEAEIRRLPVTSDLYWKRKRRRNALRRQAPAPWLGRMGYGSDYEPVFREGAADWRGRWRLVRELADRWLSLPMEDIGGWGEVVQLVDQALQRQIPPGIDRRPLPPSLREWIALNMDLCRHPGLSLADFTDTDPRAEYGYFLGDEGEAQSWWVPLRALGDEDPPVDFIRYDWDILPNIFEVDPVDGPESPIPDRIALDYWPEGRPIRAIPRADHVTHFALRYLLRDLPARGQGCWIRDQAPISQELVNQLWAAFPIRHEFSGQVLFEARNMLVHIEGNAWSWGVWKPVPRASVPEILRRAAGREGILDRMIIPE